MDAVVLIPIKAFHQAKGRLQPALTPPQRERLARWMAERVLMAAGETPTAVVCDDPAVAAWAAAHGAQVLWEEHQGLNGAVARAVATLRSEGHTHVTIVHGDLPLPQPLAAFSRPDTITLVPDTRLDGTNLLAFPLTPAIAFEVAYGAGSFRRHLATAMTTGAPVEVVRDRFMALDIDHPADLHHPLVSSLVKDVLPTWLPTNPVNPPSIH